MTKRDDFLRPIPEFAGNEEYPLEFRENYIIMECLSEREGITTFLVQDHDGHNYIAKCYDRSLRATNDNNTLLKELDHKGLPKYKTSFEDEKMLISIREYVEGLPLSDYALKGDLSSKEIIRICIEICDVLAYLHHRDEPIIHRDVKPQNIIIRPDGSVCLIDFDIARVHRNNQDTDTVFFGTRTYAPPEQYGFSQTDGRTDIYSLGILLRWLLTGSTKENHGIKIYRPLEKIIRRCTAFAPKDRFTDIMQVKKALLNANPQSQIVNLAVLTVCIVLLIVILGFGSRMIYRHFTSSPFKEDAIPAFTSDAQRVADAVSYMKKKYNTSVFDETDTIATIGDLRNLLIDLYGLDREYVYGINMDIPQESESYFLPWGWDDGQMLDRDIAVYAAVKVHDSSIVADWSSLKDDNGYYPGVRVAVAFAEKTGIMKGANHPGDIPIGELAIIFANADRIFEETE